MARFVEKCALGRWLGRGSLGGLGCLWVPATLSLGYCSFFCLLACFGAAPESPFSQPSIGLNPALPDTKPTSPWSWGCYLFGYNLFLTIISATFVAFPMGKHLGASSIAGIPRPRIWVLFAPVTEELLFRLPLRYSVINFTITALLITLLTVRRLLLKLGSFGLATATERWLWSAVFGDIGRIRSICSAAERASYAPCQKHLAQSL